MKRLILTLIIFGLLIAAGQWNAPSHAQQPPETVIRVLHVKGIIDPLVVQYVRRNLEQTDTSLFVITLNTPGGSLESMRAIIQDILSSPAPVVVYVSPPGARAGSAGTFITLAGHVAAMAPSTNIGAATPVDSTGQDIGGVLGDKITQDTAALARTLAERYGRNAEWAEQAVLSSVSITAEEALSLNVVDLLAADLDELLELLHGRTVSTVRGEQALSTQGVKVIQSPMTAIELFLHTLVNPNIAYVLMLIGMLGILIELYNPGAILPGVAGAICLILAFIASESLPLNWGGVALIVLALAFFALDIHVAGFALTVGGIVALVLGSLILFSPFSPQSPTLPHLQVNRWLIAGTTVGIAGMFLFALGAAFRAQRLSVPVGVQTVVGAEGTVQVDLDPAGIVLAQSESWSAIAEDPPIRVGERIVVTSADGVRLTVRRAESPTEP
jgi:membrane-bound serine protease (ClpP class)